MNEAKILQIAVAIIIDSKNRLLVVQKHSSTYYQLPGGKIETDESPQWALQRELLEELDLQITEEQIQAIGIHEAKAVNEVGMTVRGHVFQVKLRTAQAHVRPHAELKAIHWLTVDEVADFKLANLLKEFALPIWLG